MTAPAEGPATVTLTDHDHTGPDWRCETCKPLADVLRARMRWASMHWGRLHDDAYPSLARAVHEAGYARVDALTADLAAARDEIRRLEDESAARFASANVLHAKWQDAEQDLERVIANVRALADEWQAEGESLARNPYSGRDVHEGMTQQQCANAVRALLPAAPTGEGSNDE